jgi:hypothetical protein
MLTKEAILTKVNTFDIFNHFLARYNNGYRLEPGRHISNPFLSRQQNTPSFNIFQYKDKYKYKDFATGDCGDAFDLVMRLYNCNFKKALQIINQEMCLGLSNIKVNPVRHYKKKEHKQQKAIDYSLVSRLFTDKDLAYWKAYGVDKSILSLFNVISLESYTRYYPSNTRTYINDNLMFCYRETTFAKIYSPLKKKRKFGYVGQRPRGYLFGYKQLPYKGKRLYLTGGEKDVITLRAHNKFAVCMNSENSNPAFYPQLLELWQSDRFEEYCVLFDNDKTGEERSQYLSDKYNLIIKKAPKGFKDVSDWFLTKY